MINLIKFRRSGLWLLSFIAALLVLSPSASAFNAWRLFGENYGGNNAQGEGTLLFSGSGNEVTLTVQDWQGGKFRISANDWWFGPSSDTEFTNGGSVSLSTASKEMSLPDSATGKTIEFKLKLDKVDNLEGSPTSLTASWSDNGGGGGGDTVDFTSYYLAGANGSWGTSGLKFSSDGTVKTSFTASPSFKLFQDGRDTNSGYFSGSECNYSTGITDGSGGNFTLDGYDTTTHPEVTFTLTLASDGKPTLTATWSDNGGGDDPHTPCDYLITGRFDGWANDPAKVFTASGNKYVYTVSNWTNGDGFLIKNKNNFGDTYGNNDMGKNTPLANGAAKQMYSNGGNTYLASSAEGKTVTFTLTLTSDGKPDKLTASWDAGFSIPVYPIGVYNRSQLSEYNEPTYYLLGEILNHEVVTPEYQFTKATAADVARLQKLVADGDKDKIQKDKYILEYTMRNTQGRWTHPDYDWYNYPLSVKGYSNPKASPETLVSNINWENLKYKKDDKNHRDEYLGGEACIAVLDPAAKTLTIIEKKNGKMPFISLVGANWTQNKVANDGKPYENPTSRTKDGHKCNTDDGWQEAWIQYNDKGEIAKDLNGKVMYNTMWPPRNVINFQTEFKLNGTDYNFSVKSEGLVLNPTDDEAKSGENWKKDARFKDVQSGEVAKANLFTGNGNGDLNKDAMTQEADRKENEFYKTLALDNNTNYRLYKVENVWINGKFKFWTGWTGGNSNSNGANWNNHTNWGHYKKQNSDAAAQKISPKSTVPLSYVDGDMVFDEPTYFKTLYFFYDVEKGLDTNRSVFFTELAKGGAEIAALSRENYTYGMYRPRLTDKNGILGASITGVKITSYKDEDNSKMFVVFNETYEDKTVNDWESLFTYNENGGWVYDTSKYPNGNYIYVMEVSIKDVNGVTDKIVVESNPFTVFRGDASASIRGYQLVKRQYPGQLPGQDGLGDEKYNYVTYTDDADDSTYLLKLEIKEDGKYGVLDPNKTYSLEDLLDMDSNAYIATEGDAKIPVVEEIDGSKIDFTDGSLFRFSSKILLVGDIVGTNVLSVELLDKDDDPDTNPLEGDRIDNDNDYVLAREDTRYLSVVEPDIEKNGFHYNFTWKPNYNYTFEVADGSIQQKTGQTEASLSDYLVLPEPKLISEESQIEMFYGDSPDNKNNDNVIEGITFSIADNMSTYEDEDGLAEVTLGADDNSGGARFQQLRTAIVIERPNVTRRFMALAADYINNSDLTQDIRPTLHYYDEDDDYKNSSPLIEAIYDFKLGGEQITLTNGRVYNDNGNNPDWFVYYTPARKPSYLYFDVSSLGNDEISGDPSKNIGAGVGDNNYFQTKYMTHTVRSTYKHVNFLNRWEDGKVHGIRIQQNAPHNSIETTFNDACENGRSKESSAVRIVSSTLAYDSAGDLIERVTIRINYKSDTENKLYRVDDSGEAFDPYDDSYEGKPLQYSDNSSSDYFYIRLVNKADEDLLPAQTVSAANLADGYELTFERNHGHFWDDQIETVVNDKDNRLTALVANGSLKISHLYPFVYGVQVDDFNITYKGEDTTEAPARMMRKAEGDEDPDTTVEGENKSIFDNVTDTSNKNEGVEVEKSDSDVYTFGGEVVTSVDELSIPAYGYVVSGVGYIEVHGEGAEIYGADGIKIATGEGRYEVGAGVYVVRFNGRVEKVIVR